MSGGDKEQRYLRYIAESIDLIVQHAPPTEHEFLADQWAQSAILWRVQTLADAVKTHLSDDLKGRHPTISWREIAGFRNVAGHGYGDIRLELLWEIVTEHLQPLRDVIGAELR